MAPRGKTLVFDLETQYLANEVGGWSNIDRMRFAAGVVYVVEEDAYRHFLEPDVPELIAELQSSGRIIGYNLLRFDYSVLRPYGLIVDHAMRQKSMDLMLDLYERLGFRPSLDSLAEATLGERKSADGLAAVAWYREGLIEKVLAYCEQDVRVTYQIYAFGMQHGYVQIRERSGRLRKVSVPWAGI